CLMWLRLRGSRVAGAAAAVCAALTAMLPELPLTATTASRVASQLLTSVHVLAATVWIGGLVVLATAGLQGRRSATAELSGVLADEWRRVWERFSVAALLAVGALIVSGSWLAWSHVGAPAQFVTTAYGRYLAVKLILVLSLVVAGAYNVRVFIPRIRAARDRGDARTAFEVAVHHFPVVVAAEAVLATGVLVIVPFLRGSARSEAGGPNAGPFDAEVFGVGVLLVALLGAAFWLGTRIPSRKRVATVNPTG
ncbi:MAG: CopD family protein, partial [Actinomycetota bacterium]|nr:CopD family protein [Actinomycetota bacterium]